MKSHRNIAVDVKNRQQVIENFWNCVHFHPTDAIEDAWGQDIIRSIAGDGVARFMRMYAMLEDIVTRDEAGNLCYDFTLNDTRMDFLVEQGFTLLVCLNFMPDAIASNPGQDIGIPRYKGKRVNNSVPADYRLWEEICYVYVQHLIDRYGIDRVGQWYFHCWNEPDHEYWVTSKVCFDYEKDGDTDKIEEYCKLYDYFAKGVQRASDRVRIGGPSAAFCEGFIKAFLHHAAAGTNHATGGTGSRLDFMTMHAYSDLPYAGTNGTISPENIYRRVQCARAMLDAEGFCDAQIIVDEWGAAAGGFLSMKKNPLMELRENEFYPAFYFRLIDLFTHSRAKPEKMLICLSGQHKSTYDFDGYRSMFTLSGYQKPIYNAFALASRLGNVRLACEGEGCIATCNGAGDIAIALYQGGENPQSPPPGEKQVTLQLDGLYGRYTLRKSVIDATHANAYRCWQSMGAPAEATAEQQQSIAAAGKLRAEESVLSADGSESITVTLSGHSVVLLELVRDKAGSPDPAEAMTKGSFTAHGITHPYRLYVPAGQEKMPLVLYLHGLGFCGEDNRAQIENGYIAHLIAGQPCVVVAPQCPVGDTWLGNTGTVPRDRIFDYSAIGDSPNCRWLHALAEEIARICPVDTDRIYLLGRSMGGHAVWRLCQLYPGWAAAAVAVTGGMDQSQLTVYKKQKLWMFHGTDDRTIPLATAQRMYDKLSAAGCDGVQFTAIPGAGHMSIDDAIAHWQPLYDWMFSQKG